MSNYFLQAPKFLDLERLLSPRPHKVRLGLDERRNMDKCWSGKVAKKGKGPELGTRGRTQREAVGGDSPPGMLSVDPILAI